MSKLLAVVLSTTLFAAAAVAAPSDTSKPTAQASSGTYYWLHPKLGHVKVDRATNFMVTAKRPATKTPQQMTQDGPAVTQ